MQSNTKAYIALAVVCVVWGTTYLAMRIGVSTFPAFLFSGVRQVIAGGLMFGIILVSGKEIKITRTEISRQVVAGVLMITMGNGLIGWAERYISSGLAALIVSVMPLYVVFISYVSGVDRKSLNKRIILGLLLGCIGIGLIFRDNLADLTKPDYFTGILAAFFAAFCWAAGSVYTKHKPSAASSFVNAAFQLSSGGVALLVLSFFFDDLSGIQSVSNDSIWALAYLVVFGSLMSYGCYLYALERLPAGLASVYAYINPLIAILLGYAILNEKITWITGMAFVITITGVYWINRGYAVAKAERLAVEKAIS
jgi:drug/metabolite transporter (DMT)-like permease